MNQAPPLEPFDAYATDAALVEAIAAHGATWAEEGGVSETAGGEETGETISKNTGHLSRIGRIAGCPEFAALAHAANTHSPVLKTHDPQGRRVSRVDFHPSYHAVMRTGIEAEVPSLAWREAHRPAVHVARSALSYMMYQAEAGTQCPQTMTYACVPALRRHATDEQLARCDWVAKATSAIYDERDVVATEKRGITIGMSMTERQGGSDVRANTTTAEPVEPGQQEGSGAAYFLHGHKWFTSAPMSDAFLTLAHAPGGLSCFIVPRHVPHTGERNRGLHFYRLKDKIGDRSNASGEVEYRGAYGEMLGEEGRGVAAILEMVHHTRLDCLVASAGVMRRCVTLAAHHCSHRMAFGSQLVRTPLMANVLADLQIEAEASTHLAMRVAATFGNDVSEHEAALGRIATALAKFHLCKQAPGVAYEAMECHGGNGYIEDFPMARAFRQAPLNAIWEGSGNIICLDVARAAAKSPDAVEALFTELAHVHGASATLDNTVAGLGKELKQLGQAATTGAPLPGHLRRLVSGLSTALQASTLLQHGDSRVAAAFIDTRFSASNGIGLAPRAGYGLLPEGIDCTHIVDRAIPERLL